MPSTLFESIGQKFLLLAIVIMFTVSAAENGFSIYHPTKGDPCIDRLTFRKVANDTNKYQLSGSLYCKHMTGNHYAGRLYFVKLTSPTDSYDESDVIKKYIDNGSRYIHGSDALELNMNDFSGYSYFRVFFILNRPYGGWITDMLNFPVLKYTPGDFKPFSIADEQPIE